MAIKYGPAYWWAQGGTPISGTLFGPGPTAGTYWMLTSGRAWPKPLRAAQLYETESQCRQAIAYKAAGR